MTTALLFLSVSLPKVIQEHGPEIGRMYLMSCGIMFNVLVLILLIWR